MSQENVEMVRSATEAYIAGDSRGVSRLHGRLDVEIRPDVSRWPEAKHVSRP